MINNKKLTDLCHVKSRAIIEYSSPLIQIFECMNTFDPENPKENSNLFFKVKIYAAQSFDPGKKNSLKKSSKAPNYHDIHTHDDST